MKNITLLLLFITGSLFSQMHTIVSIPPIKSFVKEIGKEKVDTTIMVPIGASPHHYEPKASAMIDVSKATLYFKIGVEFEDAWLPKFQSLNPQLKIIELSKDIKKIPMATEHHEKYHQADGLDPHIWTSPSNVKIIAQNIYEALSQQDPKSKSYYQKNLRNFLKKIEITHQKIKEIFSTLKEERKFMVFHPSWGYFAHTYNLTQFPVEVEGKSPKAKVIISLLKVAKKEHIKAIFTQPEFSDSVAKMMAKALKIPVIKITPLAPNWSENLLKIAKAIANEP